MRERFQSRGNSESRGRFGSKPGGRSKGRGGKTFSKSRTPFRRQTKQTIAKGEKIDYKNLALLQRFSTDRGRILSHRLTGISAKEQRRITLAVKLARYLALLPTGSARRSSR